MTYMIAYTHAPDMKHMWLPTAEETHLMPEYGLFDTIEAAQAQVDELNVHKRHEYDRNLRSFENHREAARRHHQTELRHREILVAAGEDVREPVEPFLPDPLPYEQWLTRQNGWYHVATTDGTAVVEPTVPTVDVEIADVTRLNSLGPGSIVTDRDGIACQLGMTSPLRWKAIGDEQSTYTAAELVEARGPIRVVEATL